MPARAAGQHALRRARAARAGARPAPGRGSSAAGIACDTRYLAFAFADAHRRRRLPVALARAALHRVRRRLALHRGALRSAAAAPTPLRRRRPAPASGAWTRPSPGCCGCAPRCEPFLDALPGRRCRGSDYDVVGFTSTFEQNLASLALARRAQGAPPRARRSCSAAPTGRAAMGARSCTGASASSTSSARARPTTRFPRSSTALDDGRATAAVPGSCYRAARRTVADRARHALVRDLDALPMPDFDPYFARPATPARPRPRCRPTLLLETARGLLVGRQAALHVLRAQRRLDARSAARAPSAPSTRSATCAGRYGVDVRRASSTTSSTCATSARSCRAWRPSRRGSSCSTR